jgi:hypothetical protein
LTIYLTALEFLTWLEQPINMEDRYDGSNRERWGGMDNHSRPL